jgi:hypothetical protein
VWEEICGAAVATSADKVSETPAEIKPQARSWEALLGSIGYEIRAPEENFMTLFRRDRSRIPLYGFHSLRSSDHHHATPCK